MCGCAQQVEQCRFGNVKAGEAQGALTHPDIECLLEIELVAFSGDADRTRSTDIDDSGFAPIEKALGAGLRNGSDLQRLGIRHDTADDHAIEMTVGEIGLSFAKQPLDHEPIAQTLRVTLCCVLGSYDLAY